MKMKPFKGLSGNSKEESYIKAALEAEDVIISPDTQKEIGFPLGRMR